MEIKVQSEYDLDGQYDEHTLIGRWGSRKWIFCHSLCASLRNFKLLIQLSGLKFKLFFDKPTHCNVVSIMASKKEDAVFSQKEPILFNLSAAKVSVR